MAPVDRVRYEHRQTGWAMLALAFLPVLCFGIIVSLTPVSELDFPQPLLPGLCGIFLIVVIGFTSLSVQVTRDYLVVRFGIGFYRKFVAIGDVASAEVVRTRWYEGWGVHWTRRGMLYNVAGFDAVRVVLGNGKALTIGSDEAPRLAAAIQRALDERRRASDAGR